MNKCEQYIIELEQRNSQLKQQNESEKEKLISNLAIKEKEIEDLKKSIEESENEKEELISTLAIKESETEELNRLKSELSESEKRVQDYAIRIINTRNQLRRVKMRKKN